MHASYEKLTFQNYKKIFKYSLLVFIFILLSVNKNEKLNIILKYMCTLMKVYNLSYTCIYWHCTGSVFSLTVNDVIILNKSDVINVLIEIFSLRCLFFISEHSQICTLSFCCVDEQCSYHVYTVFDVCILL